MDTISTDEEIFIREFRASRKKRKELIAGLIGAGRLSLNIPRSGLARRIAERLRGGSFSEYYEFEKLLARALHPVLANLNLNAVADILVNRLFSERYSLYARDVNITLASGVKFSPQALKNIIVKMAEAEGHYMVIKFYDLVLRGIDPALVKSLKPVEACVILMKNGLGDDMEKNRSLLRQVLGGFHGRKGDEAAELLLTRMDWDPELRAYVPQLADEAGLGSYSGHQDVDEEAGAGRIENADEITDEEPVENNVEFNPVTRHAREDAISRYARMIKKDYLDAVDPDDEQKIRGIITGIYIKNEKVYNSEKAADTVRNVIALWLADASLNDRVRQVLTDIAKEEEPPGDMKETGFMEEVEHAEEPLPGRISSGEGAAEDMIESELPGEDDHVIENGISAEEQNALVEDIPEDTLADMETETGPEIVVSADSVVSGEELDALQDDMTEEDAIGGFEPISDQVIDNSPGSYVSGDKLDKMLDDIPDKKTAADAGTGTGKEIAGPDENGVSIEEMGMLLDDMQEDDFAGKPMPKSGQEIAGSADSGVSGEGLDALLDGFSGESAAGADDSGPAADADLSVSVLEEMINDAEIAFDAPPKDASPTGAGTLRIREINAEPAEDSFLVSDEESQGLVNSGKASPHDPVAKDEFLIDDMGQNQKTESDGDDSGDEGEDFIVKDEILFEDRSLQKKAEAQGRKKAAKVRITMRDIADSPQRKNLLALMELLAETDSAADVSQYLVGSGIASEVKAGISKLLGFDDCEGAFEFITESDLFDYQEKIIILQKWLKPVGAKLGWFEAPHDERLARIKKVIETYAGSALGSPAIDIPQKAMLKTGDESIRLSHDIEEFQGLYEAGIDDTAVAERLPGLQRFFNSLAAGEESAVHFAVYHKPAFLSFVAFIDEHPGLKEQLEIGAALKFCKRKKIV